MRREIVSEGCVEHERSRGYRRGVVETRAG